MHKETLSQKARDAGEMASGQERLPSSKGPELCSQQLQQAAHNCLEGQLPGT